jgi:hypothetical protein
MFLRRRRWLRLAMTGGGTFGAGKKSARRSAQQALQAQQARPGQRVRQHDDERNERLATDPEFTAARAKRLSG